MPIDASKDLSWQSPLGLSPCFLREERQVLPPHLAAKVQDAFREMFRCEDLARLHEAEHGTVESMAPAVFLARVAARMEGGPSKHGKHAMRAQQKAWNTSAGLASFHVVYSELLAEFVAPQFPGETSLLYQAVPVVRAVFPGAHPSVKFHCDADYWHDSNEVNFWCPVVPVAGGNTLWCESEPQKGDFHALECDGSKGELFRFYGNRCRHFTKNNDTPTCRVSFDFRVVPGAPPTVPTVPGAAPRPHRSLFATPVDVDVRASKPLVEGGYYKRLIIPATGKRAAEGPPGGADEGEGASPEGGEAGGRGAAGGGRGDFDGAAECAGRSQAGEDAVGVGGDGGGVAGVLRVTI